MAFAPPPLKVKSGDPQNKDIGYLLSKFINGFQKNVEKTTKNVPI